MLTGTNEFATQEGMNIGKQRHIYDIKQDKISVESDKILGGQSGQFETCILKFQCICSLTECYLPNYCKGIVLNSDWTINEIINTCQRFSIIEIFI